MDDRGQVANFFGVWGHPQTFFINREGKIVGKVFAEKDWAPANMKTLIEHLLQEDESN